MLQDTSPTTTAAIEREAFDIDLDIRYGAYPHKAQERRILSQKEFSTADRSARNSRVEMRWVRQECLGRGSFGEVWLEVREGEPPAKRAVKEIQKTRDFDYMKEVQAMVEFSKMKYRQDGHFVDFLGWFDNTKSNTVSLAMEYFPLGDLDSHMTEDFSDRSVKEISTQILHGLKTMHAEGFTHRDLKPANIFVVQQIPSWWIKLGDFGISKRIENSQTALRTMVGTYDYMAPEFFGYVDECDEESSAYTNAVDLWAVGCIIYKLYTRQVPFSARENLQPLKLYCWGKRPFPEELLRVRNVKSVTVGFISRLLEPVPSNRLTAEAALETPWLNSVDGQPPSNPDRRKEPTQITTPAAMSEDKQALPYHTDMVIRYHLPGELKAGKWPCLEPDPQSLPTKGQPLIKDTHRDNGLESLGEDGEPNPIYLTESDKAPSKANAPPPSNTDTTVKPVTALEAALTIRMPKLAPAPRLIDCPLARDCSLCARRGLETEELLQAHLTEVHRDWQRTLKRYTEMGWNEKRTVKLYDCPLARECSRLHVSGFDSEEEVLRHMDVQHGHKDPKEGDILVPNLSMYNC